MAARGWRLLLGATLAAAFLALGFSLLRKEDVPGILQPSFLSGARLPELLQRIRNFHRVIAREGRKVLEVSAKEASYYRNDAAVEVVEPKVVFYEGGERVGEVSADTGRIFLDGTEVKQVEVRGNVLFQLGRLRITTDQLHYDRETRRITAPGQADVEAAELSLTGTGLAVDVVQGSVVLESEVHMILKPRVDAPAGEAGKKAP